MNSVVHIHMNMVCSTFSWLLWYLIKFCTWFVVLYHAFYCTCCTRYKCHAVNYMNRRNSARWVNETHGKMRSAKIEVLLNAWMVVETEKQKHTEKQFFLRSSKIENSNQGCSTWLYMHVFCGLNLQKWELVVSQLNTHKAINWIRPEAKKRTHQ